MAAKVVATRFFFAIIFNFSRKYAVTNSATSRSRDTLANSLKEPNKTENKKSKTLLKT
jgi:hypothetical protein